MERFWINETLELRRFPYNSSRSETNSILFQA